MQESSRAEARAQAVSQCRDPLLRKGHRESGRARDIRGRMRDCGAEKKYRLRYSCTEKMQI